MDEDESLNQPTGWVEDSTQPARNPYELLMRQSRKMGQTATKKYNVTKEFLQRDVTTLAPPAPRQSSATRSVRKLNKIIAQSKEVLAGAKTFGVFPDIVILDRTKLTITRQNFIWSTDVISIRIEDILNVSTSIGPFFGSLTISSRVMNSTDHYEINYFWRKDAIHLKHIIQGYVIAVHNGVDTSQFAIDKLREKLEELGHDPTA